MVVMSKYDLYRNTICKEDDNDYILLFKDEESAKNVYDEFNQKDKRIAELEKELAELKENSIVPKFNFGDTIFAVVTYIDDPKDKTVIESGIVQKIGCDKNQIKYWCDNGRIYWEDECEKLFATEQEAQHKLIEQSELDYNL